MTDTPTPPTPPARRRPGRSSGSARPGRSTARYRALQHRFPATPVVSEDELEAIHDASLTILEEIGMDFVHDEARQILKRAGADVRPDTPRVRFDRNLVLQAIKTCPSEFTLHARNPERNVRIGGKNLVFAQVASPPNCSDLQGGRRAGNQRDFRNLVRLAQRFDVVHAVGGYPVEPVDLHASIRHLDCLSDIAKLTDKPFHAYSLGQARNRDGLEIVRIARGITHERLEAEPSLCSIINSSSPLRLDTPMLQGIIEMSSRNQAIMMTPFTLAGAMAPVTIAGALAQQNAEALAGIAFTQMVRPGAPVVYGGFTSNVDMKSGAPAFGTPEYMKAVLAGGQLCRKYGIPYRSSNACAANTVDAQAAYESVFSLWALLQGGANFVLHAAGWMEGGLTSSFEKFIIDVDLLQMVAELLTPLDVSPAGLGLDAIREVGPGGHYFGTAHTLERFETAFYAPIVSDWRNFESWSHAGSPTAMQKANAVWQKELAEYERPPMDTAIEEELDAFVARRKQEGGAPTDF
jgi:trimethylamine--corrinoid protein Co-methyltransferase